MFILVTLQQLSPEDSLAVLHKKVFHRPSLLIKENKYAKSFYNPFVSTEVMVQINPLRHARIYTEVAVCQLGLSHSNGLYNNSLVTGKLDVAEVLRFDRVENIVGKEENNAYQHFLPLPSKFTMFSKGSFLSL